MRDLNMSSMKGMMLFFGAGSDPHTGAERTIITDHEGAIKVEEHAKVNGVKRYLS